MLVELFRVTIMLDGRVIAESSSAQYEFGTTPGAA